MKEQLLSLLKKTQGPLSGEKISQTFGVTRAAVWKAAEELRRDGYPIEAVSKKGYLLAESADVLHTREFDALRSQRFSGLVHVTQTTDSTNAWAKRDALNNHAEAGVYIAERQTAGRGRLGRQWQSGQNDGVWMSILIQPEIPPDRLGILTLLAGVCVVRALRHFGIESGIKWPNDVLAGGKKICGILTEMVSDSDRIKFAVVGIGVNVNRMIQDFDEELRGTATSMKALRGHHFSRAAVVESLVTEFEQLLTTWNIAGDKSVLEQWEACNVTLGSAVSAIRWNGEVLEGLAESITETGALVIRLYDGNSEVIRSGEVTLKK